MALAADPVGFVIEAIQQNDQVVTVVALSGAAFMWLVDRFWIRRRRITYRVHLDTQAALTPGHTQDMVELASSREGMDASDASVVLIRVENDGGLDVGVSDIVHPLTFTFGGRKIVGVEIPEATPGLEFMITPALRDAARRDEATGETDTRTLVLPRVHLNKKDRFKLLVSLTGEGTGVDGGAVIAGGAFVRDSKKRGLSRRSVFFGAIGLLTVGALIGLLISSFGPDHFSCVPGRLTIKGSTAFAPTVKQISDAYKKACSGANIVVQPTPSLEAAADLDGNPSVKDSLIAMTDGSMADGSIPNHRDLVEHPVGVIVFAVVVNKEAGIPGDSLTLDQIQNIYAGVFTNWNQLGGQNRPISIVSRPFGSGTRKIFEHKVLTTPEPSMSSTDCEHKDSEPAAQSSPVIRCEKPDTDSLLKAVNNISGAIGYAELTATDQYVAQNIHRVKLDGTVPDAKTAGPGQYPFWAIENLDTYGQPAGGGLMAAFLDYMNSDTAKGILRSKGYIS